MRKEYRSIPVVLGVYVGWWKVTTKEARNGGAHIPYTLPQQFQCLPPFANQTCSGGAEWRALQYCSDARTVMGPNDVTWSYVAWKQESKSQASQLRISDKGNRQNHQKQIKMAAYREPMMNVSERAPVSAQQPHSPWHSPVPYLFGGLAAMLGLIAFALLILACSYWKLSGYLEGNGESERDLEAGEGKNDQDHKLQTSYEEKILVIMAGQEKPTFLATPSMSSSTSTSRSSSFGDNTSTCTCEQSQKSQEMAHIVKQETTETLDSSSDQNP
ncbi:hypothetical protein VNO77_24020 [Canavalia gladiata]|uniref:Uncharacterized protein n=1 Tax=Canavalia gladiata TaxID=3824 RepID=A0AAN9Q9H3_CANGL